MNPQRIMQNAHALNALLKPAVMPNPALSVAGDDEMSNIPLLIFRDQHLPMPGPVMPSLLTQPYEKTAAKGAGDTVSMSDFETDAFTLGDPYDGII